MSIYVANTDYMEQKDIAEIISVFLRKPEEGDAVKTMNSAELIKMIQHEYPLIKSNHSTKIHLGLAMKEMGFEHTHRGNVMFYRVAMNR